MIDLHCHSTASDGSCRPGDLPGLARAAGLSALALTDHDTVAGLEAFLAAAPAAGIEPVTGVEFSCSWYDGTMHILGLWIDQADPALLELLARERESRRVRNESILKKLECLGMPLSDVEMATATGESGVMGRPHLAKALVTAGHCQDPQDAFARFLGRGRAAYVRRYLPLPEAVIRIIHGAGGVAVWAHPTAQLRASPARLRQTARALIKAGLDGMETYYPEFTPAEVTLALEVARQLSLLPSGGSDFHGSFTPDLRLGTGRGTLAVPDDILPALREKAAAHRRAARP